MLTPAVWMRPTIMVNSCCHLAKTHIARLDRDSMARLVLHHAGLPQQSTAWYHGFHSCMNMWQYKLYKFMAQSTEKFLTTHMSPLSLPLSGLSELSATSGWLASFTKNAKTQRKIKTLQLATSNDLTWPENKTIHWKVSRLKTPGAINPFGLNTWLLLRFSQSQDLKDSNIFRCPFHEITKPGCCHLRFVHRNGFQTFLFMSHDDGRNDTYNLAWIKSENISMFKVYQSFYFKNSSECWVLRAFGILLWKTCSHRLGQVKICFFHFFYRFGHHFIYHFFHLCFHSFFFIILFFIFYHFFYHFTFFFIFSFFNHFFKHFFIVCFIIFSSSGAKKNPKNGKLQFSSSFFIFSSFFIIFFIIFASSGGIDEKWWKMIKK